MSKSKSISKAALHHSEAVRLSKTRAYERRCDLGTRRITAEQARKSARFEFRLNLFVSANGSWICGGMFRVPEMFPVAPDPSMKVSALSSVGARRRALSRARHF